MSRRPRPLALPWVVLCLLAYLGSAAHFVLVQHGTCLEHGELVHEDGAGRAEIPARVAVSFEDERFTASDESPVSAHGVDAHCAHAFLRRAMPPPSEVIASFQAPAPEAPAVVVARESVEPPVAWLRLAPKASPPRV